MPSGPGGGVTPNGVTIAGASGATAVAGERRSATAVVLSSPTAARAGVIQAREVGAGYGEMCNGIYYRVIVSQVGVIRVPLALTVVPLVPVELDAGQDCRQGARGTNPDVPALAPWPLCLG